MELGLAVGCTRNVNSVGPRGRRVRSRGLGHKAYDRNEEDRLHILVRSKGATNQLNHKNMNYVSNLDTSMGRKLRNKCVPPQCTVHNNIDREHGACVRIRQANTLKNQKGGCLDIGPSSTAEAQIQYNKQQEEREAQVSAGKMRFAPKH